MTENVVLEYRAARNAAGVTAAGTQIHQAAQTIVDGLGPREITYDIPCMICGTKIEHTMTVAAAADLQDRPRGICGRCA